MLVSVVINNYNYGRFLRDAIDSALDQTYPNVEVIVVDDGSTDDSREIIASYGDRVIGRLKKNGGQSSAFNAGYSASKGDVLCMLDSDDVFLPEKIEHLAKVFEMKQGYEWCFDRVKWVDECLCSVNGGVERGPTHECDYRADVRRGKLLFSAPATSGLSFRRSFLKNIFPMPEADGVGISDEYLKVASIGLGKGIYLGEGYTLQRIHGNNAYTAKSEQERLKLKARIQLLTACALGKNFPALRRFSDKLFARAIALCGLAGGLEQEQRRLSRDYLLSSSKRFIPGILSRTGYHFFRYAATVRRPQEHAPESTTSVRP